MIIWDYICMILRHKKLVFIECIKMISSYRNKRLNREMDVKTVMCLIIEAIFHDIDRLSINDIINYYITVRHINDTGSVSDNKFFLNYVYTKMQHYMRNKHHILYWKNDETIPWRYRLIIICDMTAHAIREGYKSVQEYYLSHYYDFTISLDNRRYLEIDLGLLEKFNAPICECDIEYYYNIDQLIKSSEEYYAKNNTISKGTVKNNINDLLKPACDKYDIDIYDLVMEARKDSKRIW